MYHDLNGMEKTVFEHSTGLFGKPKLTAGALAKKLKVTPTQLSRMKKSIVDRYWRD